MEEQKPVNKEIARLAKLKTPYELYTCLEENFSICSQASFLSIFVLDELESAFVLRKNFCNEEMSAKGNLYERITPRDPLVEHLLDVQKAISLNEVEENLGLVLTDKRKEFLVALNARLIELDAELCVPGFVKDKLVAIFIIGKKESNVSFARQEIVLLSQIAEQSARLFCNFGSMKKEVEFFVQSIRRINNALEAKDVYTRGHSERVAQFSLIVGEKLHEELEEIPYSDICLYYAASFHDIGKINLPDSTLKKNGELSSAEWAQMKRHPEESAKIIEPLKKWFGKNILEGVLDHHENYDGSGYPDGKRQDQINVLARIIRVADSFDAMVTDRPYRRALIHHKVISELKGGRGKQFDPQILDAFLQAYREGLFRDIFFWQLEAEDIK